VLDAGGRTDVKPTAEGECVFAALYEPYIVLCMRHLDDRACMYGYHVVCALYTMADTACMDLSLSSIVNHVGPERRC
jgi:hypothetical protein